MAERFFHEGTGKICNPKQHEKILIFIINLEREHEEKEKKKRNSNVGIQNNRLFTLLFSELNFEWENFGVQTEN